MYAQNKGHARCSELIFVCKLRGLRRNQSCWHLDFGASSIQNWEKTCFSYLNSLCYGSPSWLRYSPKSNINLLTKEQVGVGENVLKIILKLDGMLVKHFQSSGGYVLGLQHPLKILPKIPNMITQSFIYPTFTSCELCHTWLCNAVKNYLFSCSNTGDKIASSANMRKINLICKPNYIPFNFKILT